MFKKNRGFTLIELLVVIAIIGILSTIVIVALRGSKDKASDAEIKNILSQTKNLQALDFGNGNYDNVCTDGSSSIFDAIKNAAKVSGFTDPSTDIWLGSDGINGTSMVPVCNNSATTWAATVPLVSNRQKSWCVDSMGVLKIINLGELPYAGDSCP